MNVLCYILLGKSYGMAARAFCTYCIATPLKYSYIILKNEGEGEDEHSDSTSTLPGCENLHLEGEGEHLDITSTFPAGEKLHLKYASHSLDAGTLQLGQLKKSPGWISKAEWKISFQQNSDVHSLRSPSVVSIFRVPNFLKKIKGEAYVPKTVSLSPYHHSNAQPLPMDDHKTRALFRMMTRFSINLASDPNDRDFYLRAKHEILQLEDEIRNSYEERIDYEPENLAEKQILDGCFILEILRTLGGDKFPVAEASNYYDPVFERNKIDYTGFDILNDFLMLENQIPMVVLRKLLELELNSNDNVDTKLFKVLVEDPSQKFYPFKYDKSKWSWRRTDKPVHYLHLLGLLQTLIVYGPEHGDQFNPNNDDNAVIDVRGIPRAVDLRNAGIKFKRCDGGIEKIKFDQKRATICLPTMMITDHTEVLFRNLIALEVCKASEINYVTCYVSLMDDLIRSEEDVSVLGKSGILENYLGSDSEAAKLFNGLCKGVTSSRKDVFDQVKQQVNQHYKNRMNVWMAQFVKDHFSSPWRTLGLASVIAMLLFSALQAIFSIVAQ